MSEHGWLADKREKWLCRLYDRKRNRLADRRHNRMISVLKSRGFGIMPLGRTWHGLPNPRIETSRSYRWRDNFRARKLGRHYYKGLVRLWDGITAEF